MDPAIPSEVFTLAVTGGIASGKSTLARFLADALQAPIFDADASAKHFLAHDPQTRTEVLSRFGPQAYLPDGTPDRLHLRQIVFQSDEHRRDLERILHPRVRQAWTAQQSTLSETGTCNFFIVEIPLLYETGAEKLVDRVIVVACRVRTQLRRLAETRHLPEATARTILATQIDPAERMRRCDHVAWNESSHEHLLQQATILARHLLHATSHTRSTP